MEIWSGTISVQTGDITGDIKVLQVDWNMILADDMTMWFCVVSTRQGGGQGTHGQYVTVIQYCHITRYLSHDVVW